MRFFIFLMILVMGSCQPAEEHGHAHNGQDDHAHSADGPPSVVHTIWTDKTELFVEYPALIVGQVSTFAAHFTILDGHRPVAEGTVTVSLIKGGKGIRHTVEAPSSPGIFTPALQPAEAGTCQLVFDLEAPSLSDRIVIEDVSVFASAEDAEHALGTVGEDGGAISFLKEQAWKMQFQTAQVNEGQVHAVIPTSGVWKRAPSDFKTLVATNDGVVTLTQRNLTQGSRVHKGQVLATVSSSGLTSDNLNAEIEKARVQYEQAQSELERKEALHALQIVPTAELEQVRQRYEMARTTYETLSAGYSSAGKQVVAPFDGYINALAVANGSFVKQGDALLTLTNRRSSLLEAHVSPEYVSELQHIPDIWYQPKPGVWSSLTSTGGSVLSVGTEVGAGQPLVTVFAEVNEAVAMPEGSFTEVRIAIGAPSTGPVVPASALLEDYGHYSVIVQLGGETFERRNVVTGKRNGAMVQILSGLEAGEMIVTQGAYQVRMASISGQAPAHGHTH